MTEGSTRPGPGLRRKVRLPSTENQRRAPARRGIVTVLLAPGAPRLMEQSAWRGAPVEDGESG